MAHLYTVAGIKALTTSRFNSGISSTSSLFISMKNTSYFAELKFLSLKESLFEGNIIRSIGFAINRKFTRRTVSP